MSTNTVQAFIDYNDDLITLNVSLDSSSDDIRKRSAVLISVFMLIRVFSIARDRTLKQQMMEVFYGGEDAIRAFAPSMLEQYANYYGCSTPTVKYQPGDINKRGFLISLDFDKKSYRPRFKAKGFGILGKNIDFSALLMVVLVYKKIADENKDDNELMDAVNKSIVHTMDILEAKGGRLSAREAAAFTVNIVDVVTEN